MGKCYIDVTPENVKNALQHALDQNQDSILVLAPTAGVEVYPPTKKKPYHRIKAEIIIPPEAIIGDACLSDFGIITALRLPKNRIQPEYLRKMEG